MTPRSPGRPSFLTVLLYVLIGAAALLVALLPVVPRFQMAVLQAQHLASDSLLEWVAVQVLPTMYGGSHRYYRGLDDPGPRIDDATTGRREWLNHYPAKMVVFMDQRRSLCLSRRPHYFVFASTYRGTSLTTRCRAVSREGTLRIEDLGDLEAGSEQEGNRK